MPKHLILSCYFIFLLGMNGFTQTPIESESLTIEDGLSQGYVTVIHQDQEGFLWFSTKNGLNRYDGKQFEVFTNDPDDPHSISNDWVTSIKEKGDFLIIGAYGPFLNLFHKKTKEFHRIPLNIGGVEAFSNIDSIHVDTAGQYWLNVRKPDQLIRVVFPDRFWDTFLQNTSLLDEVKVDLVLNGFRYHTTSADPNFLIVTDYYRTVKQLNIHTLDITNVHPKSVFNKFALFKKIGPGLGICDTILLDTISNTLCRQIKGEWETIPSDLIFHNKSYYDEASNLIWLQEYEDGELFAFDVNRIQNATKIKTQDAEYVTTNINTSSQKFYKDRSGILWTGTSGLGVRKISSRKLAIKNYFPGISISYNLISINNGNLIAPNNGILLPNSKPNIINSFLGQTETYEVAWIDEGVDQQWLTVAFQKPRTDFDIGIYQYKNGSLDEKVKIPIVAKWTDTEMSMVYSKDQKLYISFSNYLICFDPLTEDYQVYPIELFKKNVPRIFFMTQTANGDFWIGASLGLIRAQATTSGYEFKIVEGLKNQLCASLLTDPKDSNILWVGTKGGGLHRLDTRTMEFTYLNSRNGLPNDVIYGILNDEKGNLWLSSNKGIICYNPETGAIRNFTSADGMQSNEFNTFAFGKAPDGAMMFGGINGLSVFYPEDLKDNPNLPEVRITGLEINNQTVDILDSTSILEKSIEYTEELTLDYAKNSLTFTFAALEFTTPGKNSFSYYLEGAEEEWVHTTTDNRAAYLNLAPGKYTFKVKAANGDLVWSNFIRSLTITILPPWYRSTLAYVVYVLFVGLAVWQFMRFQRKRLELKHSVELKQKEAARLKELNQVKSKLYTNITHEFRTPLTVILGLAEQMKKQTIEKDKVLIKRNSEQLLNLINQLLDLQKLESGAIHLHKTQSDIIKFLRYLTESFQGLAANKALIIHFLSQEKELLMDFDQEKILRIHANLLSNAIKFTPKGGHIYIQTRKEEGELGSVLEFKVQDTGVGIPEAELPHIFDRFYQVDNSFTRKGEGTGIGLTLVAELVKAMEGTIQVESASGEGTTFLIRLPITNETALVEKDFSEQAYQKAMLRPVPDTNEFSELLAAEETSDTKPMALIVEDNADVIHYLIGCLKEHYQLEIAMNGEEGIQKAISHTPDLVISDVMMPEKDGFELCQTLKTDQRTSHIPITLLTAKAAIEARLEGLQKGADAYLNKPFRQDELLLILENQLALRKKMQTKYSSISSENIESDKSPVQEPAAPDLEDAFLKQIRSFVEKDLSNNEIGMPQLIRALGMSRSQIYRKVKALTGGSPSRFIRSIRLHHAKHLLETSQSNISEIAYEVGFTTPNYFSDAYFEEFGIRPNETRKSL